MRGRTAAAAVFLLALLPWPAAAADLALDGIRLGRHADYTRIVLDISARPSCQVSAFEGPPPGILVNCPGMALAGPISKPALANSPIREISMAAEEGGLRLEFKLWRAMQLRHSLLSPGAAGGSYRLVLDLRARPSALPAPVKTAAEKEQERRDIVIAIDAGHGGEDPGAIGPGGIYEKHIVLAIAREIARILKGEAGFRPVMIRSEDRYVELPARREKARLAKADLMLSIHADSFTNSRVRGASVYALSKKGATSAIARHLARQANRSPSGSTPKGSADERYLHRTLAETAGDDAIEDALEIGEILLKSMGNILIVHRKEVEQAGFAVLKSAAVPSLLVETGFISNPKDAEALSKPAHQRRVARSIAQGVMDYFRRHPPGGTLLAWQKQHPAEVREHVVEPGEYLLRIARRYGVSQQALRLYNGLQNSVIYPGQRLLIPPP